MKKIYVASNAYKPSYGGLVSYMDNISKEVELYNDYRSELIYLNNDNFVNTKSVSYNSIEFKVGGLKKLFTPYYTIKHLKSLIDQNKIFSDIENENYIIIRHFYFAAAIAMSKNKKLIDNSIFLIPLLAPVHQRVLIKDSKLIKKIYYMIIQSQVKFFEKKAIFSNINLATLSNSKKEEVQKYYNLQQRNIKVINPGINIEKYKITEKNNEVINSIKSEFKDKFILLTVCRLSAEKNIVLLLKWIKNTKLTNVHLFIVGAGEDEERLKKMVIEYKINKKVTFFGYKKETELYYLSADLFILASTYEGFGHVFLEAFASGLPVIGLKSNGSDVITASEEIIEDGYNGFVIENNIQDLESRISILKNNKELHNKMKNNALQSSEKYRWSTHLQEIINGIDGKGR